MYCIVIKRDIGIMCPLQSSHCMWQHRVTNECCYHKNVNIKQYCDLVGQIEPSEAKLESQKSKIIELMRK